MGRISTTTWLLLPLLACSGGDDGAGAAATQRNVWKGDITMLGVPEAFDRIPGDLVLHPFGHGGLNRSLIRDDALIRARMGVEKSLAGIACKRWGQEYSPGRYQAAPPEIRMRVWRAAAWSHALKQVQAWKEDRIVFDQLLESPAFEAEMRRREELQEDLINSIMPPRDDLWLIESGESREMIERAANQSLAGERRDRLLMHGFGHDVRFIKFSEGLYINVTGAHWYDCRVPRSKSKKLLPDPPPHLVVRSKKHAVDWKVDSV